MGGGSSVCQGWGLVMEIRAYESGDEAAVIALWEECGLVVAHNDPRNDIARKMAEAERLLREVGCAKINLCVRTTNRGVIEFYEKLGFSDNGVVSLGMWLEED